ncbi:MAG: 3-dehydroquinate synthase [Alphaproteobacteria bacterium]|nr:3-dehydroquinate synthase [Alphaproteobacteria bacterium]
MNGDPHSTTEEVGVALGARSYRILVGSGLLDDAGPQMLSVLAQRRVVVIADTTVARLLLRRLTASLDRAEIAHDHVVLPPGEDTKDFAHLQQMTDALLDRRIERRTTLVALGGGVIGDLTGVAAALVLRGIDFIQIPTTLLSQVDSSVGGKTGINTRHGKNLIGAFHQPRLVLADTSVLDTLPRRELLAGYAEVVKYGLLGDLAFFDWLEVNGKAVLDRDGPERRHAIAHSCRVKARIVASDERETGERALLNLGHTFGHAFEAELGFGPEMLHGEAVAIGMTMAFDLSVKLGLCPPAEAHRARRHLAHMGLPVGLSGRTWPPERLLDHMGRDKKVVDGRLTFVLARGIGKAFVSRDVAPADVRAVLAAALAA